MCRCKSCNSVLSQFEMSLEVTLQDGTNVPEEFCTSCLQKYIYRVDEIQVAEHQFEHLTDLRYLKFKDIEE